MVKLMKSQLLSRRKRRRRNQRVNQNRNQDLLSILVWTTYTHGIQTDGIGTSRKCVKSGFYKICLIKNRLVKFAKLTGFTVNLGLGGGTFNQKGHEGDLQLASSIKGLGELPTSGAFRSLFFCFSSDSLLFLHFGLQETLLQCCICWFMLRL